MKPKKISVIVITYNEEANIADCLSSLVALDYPKSAYEILVVDASDDRTAEIAASFSGVTVHTAPERGFAVQRNYGIQQAKHGLIAFTDADCLVPPQWLHQIQQKLTPDVAAVCGNVYPPKDSPYLGTCIACLGTPGGGALGFDVVAKPVEQGVAMVISGNTIYRKKALLDVGMFSTHLTYGGEDTDLSLKLRKKGYTLVFDPELYVYHKTRNNLLEFFSWNVRRGRANYSVEPFSFMQLFVFFPVWPLIGLALLFFWWHLIFVYYILLLGLYFIGTRKRAKALVARRHRIGVGWLSILFTVPALFYLKNLGKAVGQLIAVFSRGKAI